MTDFGKKLAEVLEKFPNVVSISLGCPYCGKRAELIDTVQLYGVSYGKAWICFGCDAYVGCHKDTSTPLGTLANAELRAARSAAHTFFDPLWKNREVFHDRTLAYQWLADQLHLKFDKCHIALFDLKQCEQVMECVAKKKEMEAIQSCP